MSRKAHQSPTHCLNCGAELQGKFCSACGQEAPEHEDTVWHLIKHFFEDITHYDSRLWKTMKPLMISPAFLTIEYLKGRRISYLNPVRMFIFLNFLYFLFYFAMPSTKSIDLETGDKKTALNIHMVSKEEQRVALDSLVRDEHLDTIEGISSLISYHSDEEYDSIQHTKQLSERDGYIKRTWYHKLIHLRHAIEHDPDYVKRTFVEAFLHNLPKLTFFFIIIRALLLFAFFRRSRPLMIDHAILSIHIACTFLILSIIMLPLELLPHGNLLQIIILLYEGYYFYRAMRIFYGQSRRRTLLKFAAVTGILSIFVALAMAINVMVSIWSIHLE